MFDNLDKDGLVGPFELNNDYWISRLIRNLNSTNSSYKNIHTHSEACLRVYNSPELKKKVKTFFGDDLCLWRSNSFKKVDGSAEVGWHHDRHFESGDDPVDFENLTNHFSILIALTNMDETSGLMEFIPRSHKNIEGYQKDTRPFHQRIINEHFLDIPDSVLSSRVAVPLKRGQFMLFHSGILHRSLPAKGNDFSRYSLVARLCKKNTDIPIELAQEDEIFEYPIKLNEEKRFSDKVALVTGGSRGIGKAIAAGLVKEGAKVVITGRNASKLEQAVSEISANCTKYTSIFAIKADAADFEQMEVAYKSLFDKFGPPDIVFANAATNRPNGSIHSLSHDQWFGMVSSNIQATFNTCKLAAQYMHDWGGNIITLGSAIGHNGAANNSAYAVSKAANWTLTQSLAQELNNKHINVNELIPGPVITDMNFGASGSVWKQPEDVVPTALLLAEQNLKFGATGQSWVIKRL